MDVERIRFSGEREAAAALRADAWLADLVLAAESRGRADPARIKRQLMARSLMLTEGMAPDVWAAARTAAEVLGVTTPLEIHQSAGVENAAIHLVDSPVLLEIRGKLMASLGPAETVAVFGHELGHYLAHGPTAPDGALGMVTGIALEHPGTPDHAVRHASVLAMAREITADRFGLLATRDLDAALRLEMASATGLSADALTWDTTAYLEQCTALIAETREAGEHSRGVTHPEHGMRAWALWLFSETEVYAELTGAGPATRTLADIDAEIAEVLGASAPEGLVETALALDPIPEVHECALASAVLVALADDELAEEEALAIESVFAPLVPDWQRYLVWDNAMEAFSDTGAVVIRGGARVQRSVFQILIHVMAADGAVPDSEVRMVCAIGDALQCGTLFRALLTPVLKTLGVEPPELVAGEHIIPMPARAGEAEAALRVYLEGVLRRRGGDVTLRRMARLLGARDATEEVRGRIAAHMGELGLICDPPLDEAELDRPFALALTDEAAAALDAEEAPVLADAHEPARVRLTSALTRLRDQLVSGDGRSPSIRLRRCATGRALDLFALESLSVGHAERVRTLIAAGQSARVVDGKEVGVHEGAERVAAELLALQREAKARTEETGAEDLALGTPFLTGVFYGYLVRAPLILLPVELERTQGRGFRVVPRADTPPVANQALVRLLFTKKNVPFPEDLSERLDAAAAEGVDAVRDVLADEGIVARPEGEDLVAMKPRDEAFATWPNGRVVLEPCAVLGFFPQSASDMIQDYDALLEAVATDTEGLGTRLGAAGPLLPAELRAAVGVPSEVEASDAPLVPVVRADPSQLAVLRRARETTTLVVDGPPGTGKSQVIVNLVADALARGQTVAVVCEKRAALDVVAQRLAQEGLEHLLAVVHDVSVDRRALYDRVVQRLGESLLRDHDAAARERVDEDLAEVREALWQRRQALARALAERQPTLGQLHLVAASLEARLVEPPDPGFAKLEHRDAQRLAQRVGKEARHPQLHAPDAPWVAPAGQTRPSLAECDDAALAQVEDALRTARDTARALDALREAQGVEVGAVRAVAPVLPGVAEVRPHASDRPGRELVAALLERGDDPALTALVRAVQEAFAEAETWVEDAPDKVELELGEEVEAALTVVSRRSDDPLRIFSCAWWQARALMRTTLVAQWPAVAGAGLTRALVQRMRRRKQGGIAWARLGKVLEVLQLAPVLADSSAAAAWVHRLVAAFEATRPVAEAEVALRAARCWPEGLPEWFEAAEARLALLQAADTHRAAFAPAHAHFPWRSDVPSADEVAALHEAWAMDAPTVVASDRNLALAAELHPDARVLAEQLAARPGDSDEHEWRDAVEHGWARAGIELVERRFPGTRTLDRPLPQGELLEAEALLAEAVEERGRLFVQAIVHRADRVPLLTEARPEKGSRRTPLQKAREQMLREASKRRYVLSLRGYVRQFADVGLMELLPVWLVSPETMAVLFPGRPVFDLVVMDEASQCTVEKGLPALVRGKRAVIAGDEKQMPPTAFFQLRTPGEDDDVGDAETVEADALTAESLLVLARERCPHDGLRWHYRCVHEELIAFSNHAMYGGDLFTIPSVATTAAPPALRWEAVEDGAYDRGTNPIEAERVVDLLDELFQQDPVPSVGVVTFNVQQRRAILDCIDLRAEADAGFGDRWAAASTDGELDRRPFVKNLEGVQGDERDVIVFSLGHAPVPRKSGPLEGQLYVPARFGPLGQAGGERRLNVAVSRAKRACVVVASFSPSMLSVAHTKHEGPKLFKAFLEFTWDLTHGRRLQAHKTLERVRGGSLGAVARVARAELGVPDLAAQIASRLEREGLRFDLAVGSSGFRVPLAVADRDDPAAYRVAVITEEGHEPGDVMEAHHHRPGVLAARGWRSVSVTARQWHADPDAVVERIRAAL